MQTKPKSRISRLMMATLAGSLALGGAVGTMARAESGAKEAAMVQALSASKLSLADAIRAAEATGQGIVTGAEFEVKKGGTWFDVTTQNGATEIDHRIDPMSGTVLASSPDTGNAGSDGDSDSDETDESAAIRGAKVTLLQAISGAEVQGGKVLSAEYGHEDGALAIDLTVVDAAGKVGETLVDAATGKVTMGDADGDEGAEDESKEG
jgi:uncharacterized membrane protein YkoI